MDHTIDTDTAALMAEVDALIAECAETDARIDALLARPVPITSTAGRIAALQAMHVENTAALDAIEAEQAAIAAELEAMGL
jgi:hypothetical protein